MKEKAPKKISNFNDIKKYLKDPCEAGNEILDAFESLTDAAIIFCPAVLGPQFLPLLGVLDTKDRLFKMSKKVLGFMMNEIKPDYKSRMEQLKNAYALISVTAYFEELDNIIPKSAIKIIKRDLPSLNLVIGDIDKTTAVPQASLMLTDYYADHIITYTEVKEQIHTRYVKASDLLITMMSAVLNKCNEKEKSELKEVIKKIKKLPSKAIITYETQYWELAKAFDDFALFAQNEVLKGIDYTGIQNKKTLEMLGGTLDSIDVGLRDLSKSVNFMITNYKDHEYQEIVDELKRVYLNSIQKPIIEHKEIESDDEKKNVVFPKIVDAFIPQSYKCLLYDDEKIELENEEVWDLIDPQNDIESFFIRYLSSPDSIDCPLVILGQPGSGKSLLTRVLSAQLMSESYIAIRIPLREVNATSRIDSLVAKQIESDISRPLSSGYGAFASHFNERPLIVILDGYDELLQAKGKVFSDYLENVCAFQQSQKELDRPIRIIVTSRLNLIDKARIPLNSTILRLMDFDPEQQKKWIEIWNETNKVYFANKGIRPFELPKVKGKNRSILDLAKQPLLLLMLALYDSDANELINNKNIKRTELYDKLIRRFIRRERRRYVDGFESKLSKEQEAIIDEEMMRLGIVAIGMYNRNGVVIRSEQLESDLSIYKAYREKNKSESQTLKDADSLLGGFFFIHQSKAKDGDNPASAYEFLHNTFGEFLAADFILRYITDKVFSVCLNNIYNPYNSEDLSSPNNFKPEWFYCLMFVPLYSRPVVVEMMREHLDRFLNHINSNNTIVEKEKYISTLHLIVKEQLKMVLTTRTLPAVMYADKLFDNDISLLGHIATYSLNLIIIASALSKTGYEFDEQAYSQEENSTDEQSYSQEENSTDELSYIQKENTTRDIHPWDELISLWKTWFSQTDLMGLSVILCAERLNNTIIEIRCKERFEATVYKQPIDKLLCVSFALGDSFLTGLSAIHTNHFSEITGIDDKEALKRFKNISPDIYFTYLVKLLIENCSNINTISYVVNHFNVIEEINKIIKIILFDSGTIDDVSPNTLVLLFNSLERCLSDKLVFISLRAQTLDLLYNLSRNNEYLYSKEAELVAFYSLSDFNRNSNRKDISYSDVSSKEIYNPLYDVYREWDYHNSKYSYEKYKMLSDMDLEFIKNLTNSLSGSSRNKQKRDIESTFDLLTVRNLALINPELLVRVLLTLLDKNKRGIINIRKQLFEISECFLDNISSSEMEHLRLDTVLDIILLVKITSHEMHYRRLCDLISNYICYESTIISGRVLFDNPSTIGNLIQLLPEKNVIPLKIIPEIFCENDAYPPKLLLKLDSKTLCEYLRVLRLCYNEWGINDGALMEKIKFNMIGLMYFICEEELLPDMTINQIEECRLSADLIADKNILDEIEKVRKKI